MKRTATALLLLAGIVLGTIAVRAKEPTYVAPVLLEPEEIPIRVTAEVPAGYVLRSFEVEGICCQECSGKLHGALLAVDGVREAAVDPLLKRAQALVRADVGVAALERALTFDRYSARAR